MNHGDRVKLRFVETATGFVTMLDDFFHTGYFFLAGFDGYTVDLVAAARRRSGLGDSGMGIFDGPFDL